MHPFVLNTGLLGLLINIALYLFLPKYASHHFILIELITGLHILTMSVLIAQIRNTLGHFLVVIFVFAQVYLTIRVFAIPSVFIESNAFLPIILSEVGAMGIVLVCLLYTKVVSPKSA